MKITQDPYCVTLSEIADSTYVESSREGETILRLDGACVTVGRFDRSYYQDQSRSNMVKLAIQFRSQSDKEGVPFKAFTAFVSVEQAREIADSILGEIKRIKRK